MPQKIPVTTPITTIQFTTMDTNNTSNQVIFDLAKVPLTSSQIKSMLAVSVVRESEIADINKYIVLGHPGSVPEGVDIPTLQADLAYLENLRKRKVILFTQYKEIDTLVQVQENNVMYKMNLVLNNARVLAAEDKGLADSVKVITDTYFSQNGMHLKPSAMSLPIGTHITQSAITGKMFTNKSNAVISILVVGGAVTSTLLVNPFSGVLIPDKWVNIVITNLSTTEVAAYDIFLK